MNLEDIIKKSEDCGIEEIVSVGQDFDDNIKNLEIASKYSQIKIGLGHHPEYIDPENAQKTLRLIEENHNSIACVGEIGLDFFKIRDHGEREIQIKIFTDFLKLADRLRLPVSVHSRSAGDKTIEILNMSDITTNVNLHAFSGKGGKARDAALEHNYFFSIPGSIFYSRQKQKLARLIPLENLLLETDSPVMSPIKGQVNYPFNLPMIFEKLTEIRKEEKEFIKNTIYQNSRKYLKKKILGRDSL